MVDLNLRGVYSTPRCVVYIDNVFYATLCILYR